MTPHRLDCQQSDFIHQHNTATQTLIDLLIQRWPTRPWVHRVVDQLIHANDSLATAWSLELEQ